jgi:hypothetical protein
MKRNLKKHKSAFRQLVDKRVKENNKNRLKVQKGGFLLPILNAFLPTLASLLFRSRTK